LCISRIGLLGKLEFQALGERQPGTTRSGAECRTWVPASAAHHYPTELTGYGT